MEKPRGLFLCQMPFGMMLCMYKNQAGYGRKRLTCRRALPIIKPSRGCAPARLVRAGCMEMNGFDGIYETDLG